MESGVRSNGGLFLEGGDGGDAVQSCIECHGDAVVVCRQCDKRLCKPCCTKVRFYQVHVETVL